MADLEDSGLPALAQGFWNTVDRYYSDPAEVLTAMGRGPGAIHFAPVEEYLIPQFYSSGADAGPDRELVALYPKEGTVWHDNPFAVPDAPWVTPEQKGAARVVEEYLRSDEVQREFMEVGFRPGIYVQSNDVLTPSRGLNLREPQVFLGRVTAETGRAIQQAWEEATR